jgi:hypothetical protein
MKDRKQVINSFAYGSVNGHSVLVQLLPDNEPESNNDIPKFPRQIIRLTD